VLDVFLRSSLQGNTLLLFTTDHGIPFPGHKCTLYDPGCAVSFIARPPGSRLTAGSTCRHIVSHLDLVPTILDYADIHTDYQGDGFSLRPLIERRSGHREQHREAEKIQEHDALYWEINYHAAYEPVRSVRTRKYKYIRRFDAELCPSVIAANIDDSPAKEVILGRAEWSSFAAGKQADPGIRKHTDPGRRKQKNFSGSMLRRPEELYDIETDPLEQRNKVCNASAAGVLREMRTLLNDWMKKTDDPLLKGPVPAPEHAAVDDQDEYSAT